MKKQDKKQKQEVKVKKPKQERKVKKVSIVIWKILKIIWFIMGLLIFAWTLFIFIKMQTIQSLAVIAFAAVFASALSILFLWIGITLLILIVFGIVKLIKKIRNMEKLRGNKK